jgi:tRNA modification GTPase
MHPTDFVRVAEELRVAANSLAAIAGRINVEDVLDVVFARFCIGK